MLNSRKTIRKRDKESAISLFNDIISVKKISNLRVNKEDSKLKITDMSQSGAWLEPWMIKTEEMYRLLTGDKLFDVLYQSDDNSIIGVKAKDIREIDNYNPEEDENEETPDVPISLKFFIGEASFNSIFNIENNVIKLADPAISLAKHNIDGYFTPLDRESLSLLAFKGYLDKAKTAILNLSNENELVHKRRKTNAPNKDI